MADLLSRRLGADRDRGAAFCWLCPRQKLLIGPVPLSLPGRIGLKCPVHPPVPHRCLPPQSDPAADNTLRDGSGGRAKATATNSTASARSGSGRICHLCSDHLDPVSLAVGVAVEIRLSWLVGAGRDDRSDASLAQAAPRCWAAVALVARHLARTQTWTAAPVAANGALIEQVFERDLLVPLTAGEHDGDGLAAAFGPQVQLGRKPALAAPQRLGLVLASDDTRLAAGAGGVLMGANNGRIDKVQVPINVPANIGRRLQTGQHTLPDPGTAPTVEPARHRPDRPIAPRQIAPRRTGTMDPQNAIQNAPVVLIRAPRARSLGRQQRRQALPLRVRQFTLSHSTQVRAHKRNINPLQTRPSGKWEVYSLSLRAKVAAQRALP